MKTNKERKQGSEAERAGLTYGSGQADSKSCVTCLQVFSVEQFHWKDAHRQDKTCKECRRLQRSKRDNDSAIRSSAPVVDESLAQSSTEPLATKKAKHPLLDADAIKQLAEAFLILETWQAEADTQGDLSNSKTIQTQTNK